MTENEEAQYMIDVRSAAEYLLARGMNQYEREYWRWVVLWYFAQLERRNAINHWLSRGAR